MGVDHRIESVVTQGAVDADTGNQYYVTSYYVSYMSDGASAWVDVPTLFTANSDATTLVTNRLPPVVVARNIRIRPWTWNDDRIMLRWEVNGRIGKLDHLIGFGTDTNFARFIREWTTFNLVNAWSIHT